jgi:hypothetical protein
MVVANMELDHEAINEFASRFLTAPLRITEDGVDYGHDAAYNGERYDKLRVHHVVYNPTRAISPAVLSGWLAHELTHAYQTERFGSYDAFWSVYQAQINEACTIEFDYDEQLTNGALDHWLPNVQYWSSEFEAEAREAELFARRCLRFAKFAEPEAFC